MVGLPKRPLTAGEGGRGGGLAPVALDGGHKGGLLAADEGAGPQADVDIKIEAGAQDVFTQKPQLAGLADGNLEALDGDGVFRPDVYVALLGPDGVAGNGHGLQHHMGVPLQDGAVHKGAGVPFVGVAADVFHALGLGRRKGPFPAGGEAAAPPAPQAGIQDALDHLFGGHFGKDLPQGHVAVVGDVFVDVLRVDDAAVFEGHPQLLFVKVGLPQALDGVLLDRLGVEEALDDAAL